MRLTGLVAAVACAAAVDAASSPSPTPTGTTSLSTVHLPLVTGMTLNASVIQANGSHITYQVECGGNNDNDGECGLPPLTVTEIDHKTYQGAAKTFGLEIGLSCAARPQGAVFCSNSFGGDLAKVASALYSGAETSFPASLTSNGNDLFGLPATTTYSPSEVGDVVVAITAGVNKLASATKTAAATTTSAASSSSAAASTATNVGLPRATGNAGVFVGGALAALALAV